MAASRTATADQETAGPRSRGVVNATIVSGIGTGVLATLAAAFVALGLLDRHFSLFEPLHDLWDHVGNATDTTLFAVLYLVVPPIWAILMVRWQTTRPSPRSRVARITMVPVMLAGVFGAWAWLATASRHIQWVFGIDVLPRFVTSLRVDDVDRWEALVVAGLLCLIGCAAVSVAVMLRESRR